MWRPEVTTLVEGVWELEKAKMDDAAERFEAGFEKARTSLKTKAQADILMRKRQSDSRWPTAQSRSRKAWEVTSRDPPCLVLTSFSL